MGLFRRDRGVASQPARTAGAVAGAAGRTANGLFARLPRKIRFLIMAPMTLAGMTAAGVAAMMVYYTVTIPDPLSLRRKEQSASIRILARDGTLIGQKGGARDFIPLDLLPRMVIDAVVATEDRRFNEHWGLDPVGLLRASFANIRAGRFAQGGSTLTQQLAKNLFLTPERTMARKLEELVLAFWLEMRLSKAEILELYLNRVYFGGGAYGIESASQRFFDKSARELSVAEAAVIAGLLKAPSKYSPSANPGAARARGRAVLAKMKDAGVITADQERAARAEVVQFASGRTASESIGTEYAVDAVLEKLPSLVNETQADLVVETTIDADIQRRANDVVRRELVLQGSLLSANQAAVLVLDPEGGIRAMIGGRTYADSQFNRATKARRQPGSTFKPFVYLAALESGLTPESVVYDLPISIKGWSPHNENGKYSGAVTLRQALANSINTVAVRLTLDTGPHRVGAVARRFGIRSELREEPSLALGTSEVTLAELTGAYASFANGGRRVEPHAIRRVRTASGRVLYARTAPSATSVVSVQHLGAMNDIMNNAMISGTGRRAAIPLHPAAGKTGTSQDFRDAWFVGYTAHLVAGVWVGNDNGATMNKVRGGQLPADIWRQIMQQAHRGKTALPLPGTTERPRPAPVAAGQGVYPGVTQTSSIPQPKAAAPEVLPWLVQQLPDRSDAVETGTLKAHGPVYPADPISADFIARAIGNAAPGAAAVPDHSRNLGPSRKIIVHPPGNYAGMMSLGRGLPQADREAGVETRKDCGVLTFLTGC